MEAGDYDAARRVLLTADDGPVCFLHALRLCSMLADRWLTHEPDAVRDLIDYLVAEEMRDEVDRL